MSFKETKIIFFTKGFYKRLRRFAFRTVCPFKRLIYYFIVILTRLQYKVSFNIVVIVNYATVDNFTNTFSIMVIRIFYNFFTHAVYDSRQHLQRIVFVFIFDLRARTIRGEILSRCNIPEFVVFKQHFT